MSVSSIPYEGVVATKRMALNVASEAGDATSAMGALLQAMRGGDLGGAQKAYDGLQAELPAPTMGDDMDAVVSAQLHQIGASLRSEDLAGAQRAMESLLNKVNAVFSGGPIPDGAGYGGVHNAPRLTDKTVGDMVKRQEKEPAETASKPKKPDPVATFLNYMKKSAAERYVDAWLAARNLSKEALDAMPPEERKAVLKQMEEDIKRQIREEVEKKTGIPIHATPDLAEMLGSRSRPTYLEAELALNFGKNSAPSAFRDPA